MDIASCWHNGCMQSPQGVGPSIASMSLHMGLAVFDGIMAYGNGSAFHILKLEAHLKRFLKGSAQLGFASRWDVKALETAAYDLVAGLSTDMTYYIRPIAYRGASHLWLTEIDTIPVDVSVIAVPVARDCDAPLNLQLSPVRRVASDAIPVRWKTSGSYVNSYLCRQTAMKAGFDDGLMVDQSGNLSEASAANLFLLQGDALWTPDLSGDVFPGLTRQIVIEIATSLGLRVLEERLTVAHVAAAEAAFVSSTLMELRAVDRIGEQRFSSSYHKVIGAIIGAFRDVTHSW